MNITVLMYTYRSPAKMLRSITEPECSLRLRTCETLAAARVLPLYAKVLPQHAKVLLSCARV